MRPGFFASDELILGPAAAEGFDEADGGDEPFTLELRDGAFARQRRALGRGDFEIGDETRLITIVCDFEGVSGGSERAGFGFELRGQQTLGSELVFHFLKGGQHSLAILADGFVVGRARGLELRAVTAGGEERPFQRRADRPKAARPVEPVARVQGLKARESVEANARVKGAPRDANVRVRRGHAAFAGSDVGSSLQEFAGEVDRH